MTKGFEPAVPLPVMQPSVDEQLALIALCEREGWKIPIELQTLKNERDAAAAAAFQRPPVGTISERAQAIKQNAALMFESRIEPTVVPEFVVRQNGAEQLKLEAEIAALMKRGE
jgi:hypothetical protein